MWDIAIKSSRWKKWIKKIDNNCQWFIEEIWIFINYCCGHFLYFVSFLVLSRCFSVFYFDFFICWLSFHEKFLYFCIVISSDCWFSASVFSLLNDHLWLTCLFIQVVSFICVCPFKMFSVFCFFFCIVVSATVGMISDMKS